MADKKDNILYLSDYSVNFKNLHESYDLYKNGPINFHWSNFGELARLIQSQSSTSGDLKSTLHALKQEVLGLKHTPIWIRTKGHTIPMNLFDLYNTLMAHLKRGSFDDELFNVQEVSFIGPMGPFKTSTLVDLLSQHMQESFVYHNLLTNKLPFRSFRLSVQGTVLMQYGEFFENHSILNIKQITDTGILFSSCQELLLDKISTSRHLRFLMNTKEFLNIRDFKFGENITSDWNSFFTTDESHGLVIEQSQVEKSLSFESGITGEFYLYCRFNKFGNNSNLTSLKDYLKSVKKTILDRAS